MYIVAAQNNEVTWSEINDYTLKYVYDIRAPKYGAVLCYRYESLPIKVRDYLLTNRFTIYDVALIYYTFFDKYEYEQLYYLAKKYLSIKLAEEFKELKIKLQNHLKSLKTVKEDLKELPDQVEQCATQFQKVQHKLMHKLFCFSCSVLDEHSFDFYLNYLEPMRRLYHKIEERTNGIVRHTLFSTTTGRVKCYKSSDILRVNDEERKKLLQKEDYKTFFLDFKSFEPTIAFTLFSKSNNKLRKYLKGDLYQSLADKLNFPRDEIKANIFRWLWHDTNKEYNHLLIKSFDKLFGNDLQEFRRQLKDVYDKNQMKIRTPLGRSLFPENKEHIIMNNYMQSLASEMIHLAAKKLQEHLVLKESYIAGIVYDCIILQLHKDEKDILDNCKLILEKSANDYFRLKESVFNVKIKE